MRKKSHMKILGNACEKFNSNVKSSVKHFHFESRCAAFASVSLAKLEGITTDEYHFVLSKIYTPPYLSQK